MWRTVILGGILALALVAPPAWAQQGNGPYDPFPTPVSPDTTPRFFQQLGLEVHDAALRDGRFEDGLRATADRAAAQRAGLGTSDDADLAVLIAVMALAAAALGAGATALAMRRRVRPS